MITKYIIVFELEAEREFKFSGLKSHINTMEIMAGLVGRASLVSKVGEVGQVYYRGFMNGVTILRMWNGNGKMEYFMHLDEYIDPEQIKEFFNEHSLRCKKYFMIDCGKGQILKGCTVEQDK